jgi:hypothetical protein
MKISDEGLALIRKYDPEAEIQPAHDQIFVGNFETSSSKMTLEELTRMDELGWFEEEDSWSAFT